MTGRFAAGRSDRFSCSSAKNHSADVRLPAVKPEHPKTEIEITVRMGLIIFLLSISYVYF
jgi:hypothetical protein